MVSFQKAKPDAFPKDVMFNVSQKNISRKSTNARGTKSFGAVNSSSFLTFVS